MKFRTLLLSLFFWPQLLFSVELECKFEEVYADQSIQNGLILIKDQNLRYQYVDKKLYTIIKNPKGIFLINNYSKEVSQEIFDPVIDKIIKILNEQNFQKTTYVFDDLSFKVFFNQKGDLVKRIAIQSPKINLSIYLNDCNQQQIQQYLFNNEPFYDYR